MGQERDHEDELDAQLRVPGAGVTVISGLGFQSQAVNRDGACCWHLSVIVLLAMRFYRKAVLSEPDLALEPFE